MCHFLTLLILVSVISSNAQEVEKRKFYMEALGGYGFALVNDDLGSKNDLVGSVNRLIRSDSSISITPMQGTQGPGWQFGITAGYMVHPNIGFELQATYLTSKRFLLAKNTTPTFQAEHGVVGERLDLTPQVVLNVNFKEKWSVYSKLGLVIPVWGRSSSDIRMHDQEGRLVEEMLGIMNPNAHATVRIKVATYGKFSYGFQTRLGVGYAVNSWMSVFGEARYMALSIRSKEDVFTDVDISIYDGTTGNPGLSLTLEEIDEIDRHTVYVNELTENSNNLEVNPDVDPTKPLEALVRKDNFNQLGFSFGVRFYIR